MNFENDNFNNNSDTHPKTDINRLKIILLLTSSYLSIEVFAGILTNSLALISDAGHMLTDAAGVGFSLFAITFASKKALTPQKTYGFYRLEILAALVNSLIILLLSFYIIYEAYLRLVVVGQQKEIQGTTVLIVAIVGLIVNLVGMKVLHGHAKDNLNMEGAYLEVLKDVLGSCAVIDCWSYNYIYRTLHSRSYYKYWTCNIYLAKNMESIEKIHTYIDGRITSQHFL